MDRLRVARSLVPFGILRSANHGSAYAALLYVVKCQHRSFDAVDHPGQLCWHPLRFFPTLGVSNRLATGYTQVPFSFLPLE